ncbi:MAG: flagellar assembly peptidoglycan hydrolase FlgJ [Pseudomonadales bacterium]|nr:flagellar assembly peptidoglycan hydrolase FlgJ [Pseudomonadales bacterium]
MVSRVDNQAVYTDLSGLSSISRLGRENTPEAMRQVAQQFESIFLNIVLKAMRDSNAVFAEGNYLQSNEMEFHQQNFDNQLSLTLSQSGGLGLADVLYEQMMGQYGASGTSRDSEEVKGPSMETRQEAPSRDPGVQRVLEELGIADQTQASATTSATGGRIESPEEFVKTLYPIAEEVADSIGVDPRVLLAQSALETGWGRRMIAMPDGSNSHNLFGIKADTRWSGAATVAATHEVRNGQSRSENARFRSYASYEESFRDYVKFLQENPRYQDALGSSHDAHSFTQELQDAGYATDPVYARKVTGVMNSRTMQSALAQLQAGAD